MGKMIVPGMKIAVIGCGVTGRAAVRYALYKGAEVFISDSRDTERFAQDEAALIGVPGVRWEAGGHTEEFIGQADLVLVSPGISPQNPLLRRLQERGVQVVGELAVAAGQITKPIIAVTGTNGKTTVTTLIGEMLTKAGKKVFVGGNIGTPLYDYLTDPADYDVVVVEVSSFQLASAGTFAPAIGVLLNITPDHVDWHGSVDRYRDAKMALFANQCEQNLAIINGDDPLCDVGDKKMMGRLVRFGQGQENEAVVSSEAVAVKLAGQSYNFELAGTYFSGMLGAGNCAAAILAAMDAGCSVQAIKEAIAGFHGLPHRLQLVAEKDGVQFIDDSKATNTGAVLGALRQCNPGVILIAGGRDKGDDYRLLRTAVAEKVRAVVLIGEAAGLIEEALTGIVPLFRSGSMQEAVREAAEMAKKGDVVLLSPACASFDMFRSYGHRGEVFANEVRSLMVNPPHGEMA